MNQKKILNIIIHIFSILYFLIFLSIFFFSSKHQKYEPSIKEKVIERKRKKNQKSVCLWKTFSVNKHIFLSFEKGINFDKDLSNNVMHWSWECTTKIVAKLTAKYVAYIFLRKIRKQIMLTHAQHLKLMKATLLVFVLAIHLNGVMIKLIVCRSCHFQHTQFLFSLKKISLTAFLNLCVWLH